MTDLCGSINNAYVHTDIGFLLIFRVIRYKRYTYLYM